MINNSVARMLVPVTTAALHVVWQMRVGESKTLRTGILSFSFCLEVILELFSRSLSYRDLRNDPTQLVNEAVEEVTIFL